MRAWSEEDDETIIRMLGLGKSRAEIASHFDVPKNAIIGKIHRLRKGHRKPRQGAVWTDEMKEKLRNQLIEMAKTAILKLLMQGASHTAQEIDRLVKNDSGSAYVWDALIIMERAGLVWRGREMDWRTANNWEITGCGRIHAFGQ